jgi:LppP/LprE lipoprotein
MDANARRIHAERRRRRLPRRLRRRSIGARIAAVAGTAALAGVGVAIALMVMPDHSGTAKHAATPTPTPRAKTSKAARHRPAGPSRAELAQRRVAVAELRRQGYAPLNLAEYDFKTTLRVLIGKRAADGARWAFFFTGGRYIGHDSATQSAGLSLVRTSPHTATLAYRTYAPQDAACCPHGPRVTVRFRWDGSTLTPEQAIPDPVSRLHTG